ncbi:uncharacterized protein LOC127253693 [Andrographis paniculata]|uniref:uncharacterized protein LOC127253693 n=1 Tax=Andrographis paniculata TaxID=175694 RepID=UPI0021E774CA|nr:uncharacterized protein LOC127253693 [Andrographis paniculata]
MAGPDRLNPNLRGRIQNKVVSRSGYAALNANMRLLVAKRLSAAAAAAAVAIPHSRRTLTTCAGIIKLHRSDSPSICGFLDSPWSATQLRGARFTGGDVKPGNVIERRGKIYEVIKAQHSTQGRGGAIIQVELRDVNAGSKVNERLRTDEPVERIYAQEKPFNYLYTDDESGNIVLMEPETYVQLEVPRHLFGESLVYLQDDMRISVQLYNEQAMSVSIPQKVTCTVAEASEALKGSGPTPYKRVLLDNGVTVQVPAHVEAGDKIVVNTTDNSYVGRG